MFLSVLQLPLSPYVFVGSDVRQSFFALRTSQEAKFTGEKLPATFMTSKGPITSPLPGSIS